ncbi:class I SAM-dependent methyltransferase [Aerococcus sp. HMSC06H08]|uniref:class I SAM-dependent methyltransferase n=1 Tax=Aerococcus sp. HMSC06H08 TaxID=1581129 RepID=UPI0008A54B63|nr:class I SAM-dependent methyltransferase [Aerococcus sp. HMSC06H08]OFT40627.1 methyltransferase [Aerococcus sp. HMSC06H08]
MEKINTMPGHVFLKKLGRTKLRPGGGQKTDWLLNQVDWTQETKVLEVACNRADNLVQIYMDHRCQVTGIDFDSQVIQEAQDNLNVLGLDAVINLLEMDAKKLDFADNSFDVVINEAMLTMLNDEDKSACLKEYYRILKKGGLLLTHDVAIAKEQSLAKKIVSKFANRHVHPLTVEAWHEQFQEVGFQRLVEEEGNMLLLDKETVIRDEGPSRAADFFRNGMKGENKIRFKMMQELSQRSGIHYLVMVHQKV